jgi:hypothetical protein
MFYLVQDSIQFLRSLLHVADAGAIISARQIKQQLQTYMERVEDVLEKGWEHYVDGQKLQYESNELILETCMCTSGYPRFPGICTVVTASTPASGIANKN